jgi:hypothetical protein
MAYNEDFNLLSATMPKPKPQREVISIEADAAVPDTYGLDRLMEEINILDIEGYYFSPNRKAAVAKGGPSFKQLASQPVTLLLSPYGKPGELAYKVREAIFYKLTSEGPLTGGRLLLSRRELAQLVGRSTGGKQSEELFRALMQLRYTNILFTFLQKERRDEKWVKEAVPLVGNGITLLKTAVYEGDTHGKFARCLIEVDDLVLKSLRNRYISYFNWERVQGLNMVGMMLYKRFFRYMAFAYSKGIPAGELVIDKDYEDICTGWLNLKPFTQKSRIEEQLRSLSNLVERRLLRAWELRRGKKGQWKVVAYPGTGFFADYQNIYRRERPTPVLPKLEPEPLVYLNEFHKQMGHERQEFTPSEVFYVRDLLKRYGDAGIRSLMAFGLAKARDPKSSFDMQVFGALSVYEGEWKAQRGKQAKAQERQSAIAICSVCNEAGMLEYADGSSVMQCPHEITTIAHIHRQRPIRGFKDA